MVYYFTRKKRNKKCKKKHNSCKNRCRSRCRLIKKKNINLNNQGLGKGIIKITHNGINKLLDLSKLNKLSDEEKKIKQETLQEALRLDNLAMDKVKSELGVSVEEEGGDIKRKTTKYNYIINLTYSKNIDKFFILDVIQYCLQHGKEFGYLNGREYKTKLNKILFNNKYHSKTKNNVFIYLTTIHRDSNDKYNNIEQIKKSVISELRQCIKNTKYKLKNIVIHNK